MTDRESAPTRGWLVPIGGAEEKISDAAILNRFAGLVGEDARIAVIPTASRLKDTGKAYRQIFRDCGCRVRVLELEDRADCESDEVLDILDRSDGVFMTGGNQLRLSTILGGTPVADKLRRRHAEEGLHVAGTSAGASFLSEHMIAHGREGGTPREGMVSLAPGIGLTRHAILDQHFRQRDRIGRLLAALAYNPRLIGVGLDEDTAAFISPDDVFEVVGSGAVTVVDAGDVEFTSMGSAGHDEPVCVIGAKLHVLTEGATFDLVRRRAAMPTADAKRETA